jgi:hypothetical protein
MRPSKRAFLKNAILWVLMTIALVAVATFFTAFRPLNDVDARFHEAIGQLPWLLPSTIALAVVGGLLLIGAQFLPAPRRRSNPSDAALDGAAVPLEWQEERGRFERTFEASATIPEVKEAWRRRSWRFSRQWRIFFVMMLGALLMTAGLVGLAAILAPLWLTVVIVGVLGYFAVRLGWDFWIR